MAPRLIHVPAMAGMQLAKAEAMLTRLGFVPEVVRETSGNYGTANLVITTNPHAGSLIPNGSTITLTVSGGTEPGQ